MACACNKKVRPIMGQPTTTNSPPSQAMQTTVRPAAPPPVVGRTQKFASTLEDDARRARTQQF